MKLNNETRIPVNNECIGDWINYQGSVLLIRDDENGNTGNFQFDGTSCAQGSRTGFVHAKFKTKGKYFNEDWWYKKTSWGKNYPEKVYFNTNESIFDENIFNANPGKNLSNTEIKKSSDAFWKKTDELAHVYGRPADKILSNIIKTATKKTGIKIYPDFKDTDYGVNWWEAYVPVKFNIGNKEYTGLLTWINCD